MFQTAPGDLCIEPSLIGMPVAPHVRRAGPYLLGPKLGMSPVKSIVQCLARKEGTDDFYQVSHYVFFSINKSFVE